VAYKLEVEPDQAKTVTGIFESYLSGWSLARIAQDLNARGVPPPRAGSKHRRQGWVDSTIRAILHNEKYAGRWSFKTLQWVRVPGTHKRAPRGRDRADVIVKERPELRILEPSLSEAVRARLAAVHARYTKASDGRPKGRALPGQGGYLLSGLLVCGVCANPMVIYGGGKNSRYYRCCHHNRRGTCENDLSVREDIARTRILSALRDRLLSPAGLAFARKAIVEELSDLSRTASSELGERQARLRRTEERIAGLVRFISEGDSSRAVRSALQDLEAQAEADRSAIEAILREASEPIRLPSPDDLLGRVFDLERRLADDPHIGREELRRLLDGGHLRLDPQPERHYVARGGLLPAVILVFLGLRGLQDPRFVQR